MNHRARITERLVEMVSLYVIALHGPERLHAPEMSDARNATRTAPQWDHKI